MDGIEHKYIHFTQNDLLLSSYESLNWKLNETRFVEFFPNLIFSVQLISTEHNDFKSIINSYDDNNPIALDLEWEDELCLFQFCSSVGVLIVRHPKGPGNKDLEEFLSTHKFFAKGASNDKKQLMMKFGKDFHDNIEDISQTRLIPYHHSENFMSMTLQFAGKPCAEFKDIRITQSNWSQEILTMRQVLYAAFDVVAIYQCYPNLPEPKMPVIKQKKKDRKHCSTKQTNQKSMKAKEKGKEKEKNKKVKESKLKVSMKSNFTKTTYCYVIEDYKGSTLRKDLYDLFDFLNLCDINFISYYPHKNEQNIVFISLFEILNVKEFKNSKHLEIKQLPIIDPDESYDGEFLYMTNIPQRISEKEKLNYFLCCFENDHRITMGKNFAKIEVCCAISSHNLKSFIPFISIDNQSLELYDFPFFYKTIQVSRLPQFYTDDEVKKLFCDCGDIESIARMIRRSDDDLQTFHITFKSDDSVKRAINQFNYQIIDNNMILVSRHAEEPKIRTIRRYELVVDPIEVDPKLASLWLRDTFSQFGEIHQAYYDEILCVGHVQFYKKKSAIIAEKAIKNAYFPKEGTSIIARDISCAMPQSEIIAMCAKFGRIINFVVRLIIPKFRYQIVEVTYSDPEAASSAKSELDGKTIDGVPIAVSKYLGAGSEVPMWKMEERYNWIVIDKLIHEPDIFSSFSKFGDIIDFEIIQNKNSLNEPIEKTLIMFADVKSAEKARNETEDYRIPTLEEFALEANRRNGLQIESFVPVLKVDNKAVRNAIVLDPMPENFTEQFLKELCPKCLYDFVVMKSCAVEGKRRAIMYCDGQKMTKKIYALMRGQMCGDDILNPVVMPKESVPETTGPCPVSIFIDPLPDSLLGQRLNTYILLGKEAKVDFLQSAIDQNKKMAVIKPVHQEDCRSILRSLHKWREDGKPLNVKKIVNKPT